MIATVKSPRNKVECLKVQIISNRELNHKLYGIQNHKNFILTVNTQLDEKPITTLSILACRNTIRQKKGWGSGFKTKFSAEKSQMSRILALP